MKLKARFTLIVSIFVIIIFVLTALFAFSFYKKSIKETVAQQQFSMVSALADEIDSKLLSAQQDLIAVAKTAPPDIMQNPEKAQAFLDNKPTLHTIFDSHLFLFTPAGKIFVESPYVPGRRGFDLSFREYIINTLKTRKPYISDPFVSSLPNKHPVIAFTAPLFDGKGKITGILAGSFDLLKDNFLGRLSTVKIGKAGYLYLTATDRTLIMHPDKKRILTRQSSGLNRLYDKAIYGFEGTDDTITSYGVKMVSSFKRIKAKNWILGANYPQAEAYRPILWVERYFLMAIITGIVAVFFIISFIMKYLIGPLELFTRHVDDLPQKTGDDRFLNIKTKDEIGTLSLVFNKMVAEIDKRSALERSEELYRTVIEFSTDFVYWRSPDNKMIYVSENCEKFCGYTEEEFYASPELLETIIHPDDRTIWAEHTYDINNKGILEQLELRMMTKSGQVLWISHSCLPVYDKKGNYRGRRGSHRDITGHKLAEEELRKAHYELEHRVEERTAALNAANTALTAEIAERKLAEKMTSHLAAIVQSADDAIISKDLKGIVQTWNVGAEKIFGYKAEEIIGRHISVLTPPGHTDDVQDILRRISLGEQIEHLETMRMRKDGAIIQVSLTFSPIKDGRGRIVGVSKIAHDITEQRKDERELVRAKEEAERANRAKSEFLANMSHEIRTPMNAVIGLSHLALQTDLTPKQRDYLTKMHNSAQSLLGIINDILDFSKIEAHKLEIESIRFNLSEVLDHIGTIVSALAEEKGLELMFSIAPNVPRSLTGDPLRLGQILTNLLNNAIKFTEQGDILVTAEAAGGDEHNATLRFSVRDTGIGINEEALSTLFQPFAQADSSITRRYGGTGLGLTISRSLVEMMGGELQVNSVPGLGSTFTFTVSFGLQPDSLPSCFIPPFDIRGVRVLVVDDSASARDILLEILTACSFNAVVVSSGAAAIEELERAALKSEPYRLVLMDWKMPGMDGLETARRIRQDEKILEVPVIVMVTAFGREEIKQKAKQVGIQGFLTKPVLPSTLYNTIFEALGKPDELFLSSVRVKRQEDNAATELSGARILLVEDHPLNQQVAKEILESAGISVHIANNGKEAVDALKKEDSHYDAVLMDIQMPVMDGYEAARQIRLDERHKELPIIAITAHAMVEEKQRCLDAGMKDHLAKPLDPDKLMSVLHKWVHLAHVEGKAQGSELKRNGYGADGLPGELPGIDLQPALKRINGNVLLFKKILREFFEEYHDAVAQVRVLLQGNDPEDSLRFFHTLKGVAGNISAVDLVEAAKALEAAIRSRDIVINEAPLKNFEKKLNVVLSSALLACEGRESCKSIRADSCESGTLPDIESLKTLLAEFHVLLQRKSMDALNQWELARKQLEPGRFPDEITAIERKLSKFDFKGAIDSLRQVTAALDIELK
jgi:PAS domain S-box-containing protein